MKELVDIKQEVKQARIDALLISLKDGVSHEEACVAAGLDRVTLWRWRKEDPALNAQIEDAKKSRILIVEDALYKKAKEGNIVACIFFLKNKAGWKDVTPEGNNNTVQVIIQNNVSNVQDHSEQRNPAGNAIESQARGMLTEQGS